MGKLIHIGAVDPLKGEGGVEQFARDLGSAWDGELQFLAYHNPTIPPWETAVRQNRNNLASGVISPDDIVVADGFYGLGLEDKVKRLIIVCHGSYAGMLREYNINPPPSFNSGLRSWLRQAASYQETAYRSGEVVAVSVSAAYDLYDLCDLAEIEVISNGVDTAMFHPPSAEEGWVEVAGNDERKGSDMISVLRAETPIASLGYEGRKCERWNKFGYAILPSRYEGGQYAALEALASGLTVVAYRSGFFDMDVEEDLFYGTYDYHQHAFSELMYRAEENPIDASWWVEKNASLEKFKREWASELAS